MTPRPSSRRETAEHVWATMRGFVEGNARSKEVTERFGLGPGGGKMRVLLLLQDGPMSLGQIAAARGVDAPYVTVIVDRLETLGLAERTPDPTDRRRKFVALTPAGREALDAVRTALAAPPPALERLSAAELTQLDVLLGRLAGPNG